MLTMVHGRPSTLLYHQHEHFHCLGTQIQLVLSSLYFDWCTWIMPDWDKWNKIYCFLMVIRPSKDYLWVKKIRSGRGLTNQPPVPLWKDRQSHQILIIIDENLTSLTVTWLAQHWNFNCLRNLYFYFHILYYFDRLFMSCYHSGPQTK